MNQKNFDQILARIYKGLNTNKHNDKIIFYIKEYETKEPIPIIHKNVLAQMLYGTLYKHSIELDTMVIVLNNNLIKGMSNKGIYFFMLNNRNFLFFEDEKIIEYFFNFKKSEGILSELVVGSILKYPDTKEDGNRFRQVIEDFHYYVQLHGEIKEERLVTSFETSRMSLSTLQNDFHYAFHWLSSINS